MDIRMEGDYVLIDGRKVAKIWHDAPPSLKEDFRSFVNDIQARIEEAYSNGLMDV